MSGHGSRSHRWLSLVFVPVLLACGGDSEVPPPPAAEATPFPARPAGPPDSGWAVEPPVASVELPRGFPGDVPRYPDARIARAAATDEGFAATFVTSEDVVDAAEDYEDLLDDEGWITKIKAGEEEKLIVATKDTRIVTATVKESPAGTMITLIVGDTN